MVLKNTELLFNVRIIITEDGSQSLLREDLNETYHSFHGARGESDYVFVKQGLDFLKSKYESTSLSVLEVGFGTGLNALLSYQFALANRIHIQYDTLEPLPVGKEVFEKLSYSQSGFEHERFQSFHMLDWSRLHLIDERFTFRKWMQGLEQFEIDEKYDIIFFDAFAPSKQPEVWSLENLKKCHHFLKPGGILTTYCAQGQFKRNLKEAGFLVESLPGAMGKKEMVRALRPLSP